jgi:hypothetical protein
MNIMKTNKFLLKTFAFALLGTAIIACGEDDPAPLPPIGGYNNSDEIGAVDLIAHWPLEGNGTEKISNTAPSNSVGATYEPGAKGHGVKLTNGYLAYPEINALASTSASMTVSLWAKITNNGGPGADGHPTVMFTLSRPNEWGGNINFMSETGWRASTSDTLVLKALAIIKNADGGANFQDIINSANPNADDIAAGHAAHPNKNGGQWAHYVMTWDATTAVFRLYANGVKISNPVWESRNNGNALPLNFFTPTRPVIGAFGTVAFGTPDAWQRPMNGSIDEIRVWKKVLNQADINALFELESAGR